MRTIFPFDPIRRSEEIEQLVMDAPDREVSSRQIGEFVMDRLRQLDKIAYIRFASVYLDFKNVREFMDEISQLVQSN